MKYKYLAEILELKEVHEMPDAWSGPDYLSLLNLLDYEDADSIPPDELRDMAAMALSDLEPEEAAVKVLELRLGDKLNKGQRQNLSEELKDERLWEEYAEISYHEELFNVATMLYQAFPKKYHEPDIVMIKVKVTATNVSAEINLKTPTASFIARLLCDGMDEHNAIYRLFDDSIASNSFPESEHIIWKYDNEGFLSEDRSVIFTIYTSWNWVDELKGVKDFESTAFSDGQYD